MLVFDWSNEKNGRLKARRGVCFEQVVLLPEQGDILDIVEHPNQKAYPGRLIAVVRIDDYVYLVPFVKEGDMIFLKTIIPSRKATAKHKEKRNEKTLAESEEKKLLESYERGDWRTVKNLKEEVRTLRSAARNTLQKDKRINIRMSSRDLTQVQVIAAQEGIPYQTLISSIIHKFVSGSLIDRNRV